MADERKGISTRFGPACHLAVITIFPCLLTSTGPTSGLNPVGIIIPYHRVFHIVIGKSEKLTGDAGNPPETIFDIFGTTPGTSITISIQE